MLPKSVLHKKNGHPRPPAGIPPTSAEMLRRVHAVRDAHTRPVSADLLRFAHLIRAERTAVLLAQAARGVDGLRSAMQEALARTRQRLDDGDLEDVRALLERLRADADGVARLVALLATAVRRDADERRVLDVEAVLDEALDLAALRDSGVSLVRRREPDLPLVAGHRGQLRQLFRGVLGGGGAGGAVIVETTARDGGVEGERIVRVRIVDRRPVVTSGALAVQTAAGIARAHGGSLGVETAADGGRVFVLDLPAL